MAIYTLAKVASSWKILVLYTYISTLPVRSIRGGVTYSLLGGVVRGDWTALESTFL